MQLTLNGRDTAVDTVETVADLLRRLELDSRRVVVEVNEKVVRRDRIGETPLSEHDRIEILRMVGGG